MDAAIKWRPLFSITKYQPFDKHGGCFFLVAGQEVFLRKYQIETGLGNASRLLWLSVGLSFYRHFPH